jgi:hypothetical protein
MHGQREHHRDERRVHRSDDPDQDRGCRQGSSAPRQPQTRQDELREGRSHERSHEDQREVPFPQIDAERIDREGRKRREQGSDRTCDDARTPRDRVGGHGQKG